MKTYSQRGDAGGGGEQAGGCWESLDGGAVCRGGDGEELVHRTAQTG